MLLLAIAASLAPTEPAKPVETVPLYELSYNPWIYMERPVRTCGKFHGIAAEPQERVLFAKAPGGNHFFFLVGGSKVLFPPQGTFACVTGVAWRRDGLTLEQAKRLGSPWGHTVHGVQNPSIVLYADKIEPWTEAPFQRTGKPTNREAPTPAEPDS
jgi:hypothetical protein